jgi:hypothetical protein
MRKGAYGGPCDSGPDEEQDGEAEQGVRAIEDGMLAAKATGGAHASASLVGRLLARSGGIALPASARSFMERRLGHDFRSVRVHADGDADAMTRSVSAEAFTVGNDIYFRSGRFLPSTRLGSWLLAHELAHVVQQRQPTVGPRLQGFTLTGFPAAEEAAMRTAIPIASSTVRSCSGPWFAGSIASKIDDATYTYESQLSGCGMTYPVPWADIRIGPSAFSLPSCCKLESTIAHEAAHTRGFIESRARKLECDCFTCCTP